MKSKRFRALSLVSFLAVAAVLAFYFVSAAMGESTKADSQTAAKDAKTEEETEEKVPVPVRTATVETGKISAYISATANLVPENEVKILAEWEGRVAKLNVEEGDRITAGETLAALVREDGEIAYGKAKVRATNAQMAYDRAEKLRQQELISPEAFDKAAMDKEIADHEVAEAEWRLSKTTIRAPWNGVVTERYVQPGQHVRPGDQLFTVSDFNPLVARLYLPEKDILSLEEGRSVRISLKADVSVVFHGRIRQISPVVDTATGTVKVTVETTLAPRMVRPGAFVQVDVVREARQDVVVLPREAVVRELQKTYVFVAAEGVATKRQVTLGLEENGHVEVTSGVEAGEEVIVAGQGGLKDGAAVEAVEMHS